MTDFPKKHPLVWAYLFAAYFSLSYHIPIYATGMAGFIGLRETILMSLMWLTPILLVPRYTRQLLALSGLIMLPAAIISVFYFIIYGQEFSQSTIFIVFESNVAEGSEFIASYWQWWFIPVLILFTAVPIWMWQQARPVALGHRKRLAYAALFILIPFFPFISTALTEEDTTLNDAVYHQMKRMEPAAPWNLIVGYAKYRQQMASMTALLEKNRQVQPLKNLKAEVATLPDTVILVLGESTNRQRMSLYGYHRPTTPHLDALQAKNELMVFTDVITPRPYTIEALQQILSFADAKNPGLFFTRPNLLNMMQQAGYEITWITNQQTQTRRNTMLTTFSQLADHQVYLNNNREQNANQYDEVVLPPFAAALESNAAKKLIIVHLLGTHRAYEHRFPETYNHFTDNSGVPEWVTPNLIEDYNNYDNAILYNDEVVSSLIKAIDGKHDNSLLVYFADHGEEVYDYPDNLFAGRSEAAPTSAMYTVPFVVWTSPKFKQTRDIDQWRSATDRPYSTAHFIHTFADMVGLSFTEMDDRESLVSRNFQVLPRWIGDPLNAQSLRHYSDVIQDKNPPIQTAKRRVSKDIKRAL